MLVEEEHHTLFWRDANKVRLVKYWNLLPKSKHHFQCRLPKCEAFLMYDWKLLSRSFCSVRLLRNHSFWATTAALLQKNPSYSPHCHRPPYLETPINAIISHIRTGTNILQLRIVNVRIEYESKSEDNSIRIRTHEHWPSSKRLSKPCLQPDTHPLFDHGWSLQVSIFLRISVQ